MSDVNHPTVPEIKRPDFAAILPGFDCREVLELGLIAGDVRCCKTCHDFIARGHRGHAVEIGGDTFMVCHGVEEALKAEWKDDGSESGD